MDLDAEVHSHLYENIMVSKASILIEELTLLFLLFQLTVLSPSAILRLQPFMRVRSPALPLSRLRFAQLRITKGLLNLLPCPFNLVSLTLFPLGIWVSIGIAF